MGHKQIHFRSEAGEKILKGAAAIADAVRVTLGPKSKSVLIEKKWGKPLVFSAYAANLPNADEAGSAE